MANPGSPQQMQSAQQNMPGMPKGTMIGMLAVLVITFVVMAFRKEIGGALNVVLQVINFDGKWPVLTLVIAGLIMITFSTVVRGLLTDPVKQARTQQEQTAFNAEMRQARLENNLFKLKKLQDKQMEMMGAQMETSTQMMKTMPITMIVVIPVYAWVWYFLDSGIVTAELLRIATPWGMANLMDMVWIMPMWIVIYTMISLPIGQIENRIVRYYLLKKRLKELDGAK